MDETADLRAYRVRVRELEQEVDMLRSALARAQGLQLEREGVRAVPVGRIPIDSASLVVVDPTYIEEHWVRVSEAAATAIAYGPALDAEQLGEGLSADGHHVEWVNPIQFVATPKEGVTPEALHSRAVELWIQQHPRAAAGFGGRLVALVRPAATAQRIQSAKAKAAGGCVVDLSFSSLGNAGAAVLALGGDGQADVMALVDKDGFVQRVEISLHT
ncbi:MAG TPA: hypothetical protein VNU19_04815 [Candidatus Acidoferrum sp.]|jgi:hypothetical protein|nr:hypothetical protein [Candidatus Acidoferrum sp.]